MRVTGKEIIRQENSGGLIADLGSKDKTVRARAYASLLAMREEAVPLLVKALSDPNGSVRWESARLLDEIGLAWTKHADADTINALINDLASEDGRVRVRARMALVAIGAPAVQALEKALGSKDVACRWEAAKSLGQVGDPAAVDVLVKALEDEVFEVRWLAAEALISIGPAALRPLLREMMKRPDSVWLREGAHRILHGIEKGEAKKVIQTVLAALEDTDAHLKVPFVAEKALGEFEDKGIK